MAKLPRTKKLIQEDFPSEKNWIGKLLLPLNQFLETVGLALDRNLTVRDNLDMQISTVTITGDEEVSFAITTRSRPMGVLVTSVELVSGTGTPTAAVQPVTWEVDTVNNVITVNSWHGGLDSSSKYKITLLVHTV